MNTWISRQMRAMMDAADRAMLGHPPPKPAFAPGDEVRVKDLHDPYYDRDGFVHSEAPDERGVPAERYIVDFEKGDPKQRGVYRADQLEKR